MIEDEELRDLFKIESEEHLQKLDEGLLHLEKYPDDQAALDEVFREAHSLKGAARMLGVEDVEQLSHHLEDRLGQAKRHEAELDSATVDRIYFALDAVRALVDEAVSGEAARVDVVHVSDVLTGRRPLPENRSVQSKKAEPPPVPGWQQSKESADRRAEAPDSVEAEPIPAARPIAETPAADPAPESSSPPPADPPPSEAPALTPSPPAAPPAPSKPDAAPPPAKALQERNTGDDYRIETIRIGTETLDALLNQTGELTVASQRVARRPGDIEEILNLWEDWGRTGSAYRRLIRELESADQGAREKMIERLREYFHGEHERFEKFSAVLERLKSEVSEDAAKLGLVSDRLEGGIRDARMLPLSTLFALFPRTVRDLSREQNKEVEFTSEGGDTRADKRIVEEMKDPLMHMLRNAVDHGIEEPDERESAGKNRKASLVLRGYRSGRNVIVEIQDDGRGLDIAKIKAKAEQKNLHSAEILAEMSDEQVFNLIFEPGFSTKDLITDVSGRGVGMDVVRTNVERMKGSIRVLSEPGRGSTFRVTLPTALTTTRVLLVSSAGQVFAVPTEYVEMTQMVAREDIFTLEGRNTIRVGDELISTARLSLLLELPEPPSAEQDGGELMPAFVINVHGDTLALLVDELLDEQEIILKSTSGMLKRVRNVSGMTILESGSVCVVLNPRDLLKSELSRKAAPDLRTREESGDRKTSGKHTILLAEDSITTRMQEKRILERAGYEVLVAVDGREAYQKLTANPGKVDAIVSDIEMPNMDGFAFTSRVRAHEEFRDLPVVLVTTLSSEEHRRRGMEVGANAYITKSGFNQEVLLDTLRRLI